MYGGLPGTCTCIPEPWLPGLSESGRHCADQHVEFHEPAILRSYVATQRSTGGGAEMARIEADTLEEVIREPKSAGFLEAIGGSRFLAAQFFTVLGTIFGVFLAGYVGFQRNLEYDRFVKAQQRSDLVMAMHEELKQNVDRLRKFN